MWFRRNKVYKHTNSKGYEFWLHAKEVELKGGRKLLIYYFKRDINKEYAVPFPDNFRVQENPRNGFLSMVRTKE